MKMMLVLVMTGVVLSACSSAQDQGTNSYFGSPDTEGNFSNSLEQDTSRRNIDENGEGYAYQAGVDDDGLAAQAGLTPGTDTEPWPTKGTGTFSGGYSLATVRGISLNDGFISGYTSVGSGALTLNADFAGNTLTGTSDDGILVVNGTVNGGDLTGEVTYDGVDGTLTGLAGDDQAFGAFHGNSEDLIYAGGFATERD